MNTSSTTASDRWERYVILEVMEAFKLSSWPRWLRRAFILTLPVSGPLYLIGFLMLAIVFCLGSLAVAVVEAWK